MTAAGEHGARDERLYAALLRLYPAGFRERYGDAMLDFYRDQRRAAVAADRNVWRAFVSPAANLVFSAALERLAAMRGRRRVFAEPPQESDMLDTLRQDLRYAVRGLTRAPVFTTTVVATLALAIGANVAIFAVLNGVLLRPYPFPDPDKIVLGAFQRGGTLSEPEFLDYQRQLRSVTKLAVYMTTEGNLTGDQEAERLRFGRVSGDFFAVLGMTPRAGRALTPADDDADAPAVAVISNGLWVRRFGAAPEIVGKRMLINGRQYTIVGVMPPNFNYPSTTVDAWLPLQINRAKPSTRANHYLRLVARLQPTATPRSAAAEIGTITGRWRREYPEGYSQTEPYIAVVEPIRDRVVGPSRPYLLALGGAVAFVLLVACVNVANLVLVRAEARRRELAIRVALGAGQSRLVGQLFTESALLAVAGTLVGLALAWACTQLLVQFGRGSIPRLGEVRLDATVLAFSVGISVITAMLFGVAPALRASGDPSVQMLRDTAKVSTQGGSTRRVRQALVVSEIAIAVLLLAGAGLLIKSLVHIQDTELGFEPERVLTARVSLPRGKYAAARVSEFFGDLTMRVARQSGVAAAGAMEWTPLGGIVPQWGMLKDGDASALANTAPSGSPLQVTPGYFEAMGIAIVRGRGILPTDDASGAAVVVVNQSFAKRFWPDQDAIGHTIRVFRDDADWATVVGVARDTRFTDLERDPPAMMYFPTAQAQRTTYGLTQGMTIAVRTRGEPAAATEALRRIVRELDKDVPVSDVSTMTTIVRGSISTRRFSTIVLAIFAAVALGLASIGIYGVIAYGVSQRSFELGIRMALGADRRTVVALILAEGVRMAGYGVAIGVTGALLGGRFLRAMLSGVESHDLATLALVSGALLAVALIAAIIPARRASAVSPTEALRAG